MNSQQKVKAAGLGQYSWKTPPGKSKHVFAVVSHAVCGSDQFLEGEAFLKLYTNKI